MVEKILTTSCERAIAFKQLAHRRPGRSSASELEALVGLLKGALDLRERFREHYLEATGQCVGRQRLNSWPEAKMRQIRAVVITVHNGPALLLGVKPA